MRAGPSLTGATGAALASWPNQQLPYGRCAWVSWLADSAGLVFQGHASDDSPHCTYWIVRFAHALRLGC